MHFRENWLLCLLTISAKCILQTFKSRKEIFLIMHFPYPDCNNAIYQEEFCWNLVCIFLALVCQINIPRVIVHTTTLLYCITRVKYNNIYLLAWNRHDSFISSGFCEKTFLHWFNHGRKIKMIIGHFKTFD